jgi:hypothetical protein
MSVVIDKIFKVNVVLDAEVVLPADTTKEAKDYIRENLINKLTLHLEENYPFIKLNIRRVSKPTLESEAK